jgi:hypothetical protein
VFVGGVLILFTFFCFCRGSSCLIYVICVGRGSSCIIYVIYVCRGALVLFTLFVFVGGALVLFTLFVVVEELLSYLRYFCLAKSSCRVYVICVCLLSNYYCLSVLFVFVWCILCFQFLRLSNLDSPFSVLERVFIFGNVCS